MARYVIGEEGARKIREALHPVGKVGVRDANGSLAAFESDLADPFNVRWAGSVGNGSWIVWIPSSSTLLVDGTAVNPAGNLSAAGGSYPAGWYVLSGVSAGAVYFNVHIPDDSTSSPTCNFSSSADTPTTGETVVPIVIADVSKDGSTGAVTVKQFVTSAIVLTRGGGGVEVDELSIDADGEDDKLQLLEFKDATAQTATLAEEIVGSAAPDYDFAERYDHSQTTEGVTVTEKKLRYRKPGRFVSGDDSNVVFTANNGTVKVDVYYI